MARVTFSPRGEGGRRARKEREGEREKGRGGGIPKRN